MMLACGTCVMLFVAAPFHEPHSISLGSMLEAHESSLGLVHEIQLTVRVTAERYRPDHAGPTEIGIWRWAWRGPLERVRFVNARAEHGDVFYDGDTIKELLNWDPEHPPPIIPRNQGNVVARVHARSRLSVGRDVRFALLWSFDPLVGSEPVRYSLRDVISESAPPARVLGTADVNGHSCYHVHASIPRVKGQPLGQTSCDVFLDPSVGFLARRSDVVGREMRGPSRGAGEPGSVRETRIVRDVLEFAACDGGVFIPIKVELRNYDEADQANPFSRVWFKVEDLVVNRGLSADAFDFRFPEHAVVVYRDFARGRPRRQLWGPDNKPIKEIRTADDLPPIAPSSVQRPSRTPGRRALLAGGTLLLLLVSCAALWYRRRSVIP